MAHKNPGMKTDIVELSNSKNARKKGYHQIIPHRTFYISDRIAPRRFTPRI